MWLGTIVAFTFFQPLEASQSYSLCAVLRVETTLQYTFSLAHLQMLTYFSLLVTKHRSVSFEVTAKIREGKKTTITISHICGFSHFNSLPPWLTYINFVEF
ncbi:unnamed protein product [Caenorhabditis sp. 36 PRJEB53466]|nr:unnamed protein product [Caenorhabditis sp. 36 PRJEB53466]